MRDPVPAEDVTGELGCVEMIDEIGEIAAEYHGIEIRTCRNV